MPHIDEGVIHAWLDNALDANEYARVEEHIAGCDACRRRVDEERQIIARASSILSAAAPRAMEAPPFTHLRVAAEDGQRAAPRKRRRFLANPARLAWAASLALAVGLGWFGRTWLMTDISSEAQVDAARSSAPGVQETGVADGAGSRAAAPTSGASTASGPSTAPGSSTAMSAPLTATAPPATKPTGAPPNARPPVPRPAPLAAPLAAPMAAQRFIAEEWVPSSADVAERESGMRLVRLEGSELVDVATRSVGDRVEVRTRQRVLPDTTTIELVQVREQTSARIQQTDTQAQAKAQAQAQVEVQAKVQAEEARARAERGVAAADRALDTSVARRAEPRHSVITVFRDGVVITARASMPADSLRALLTPVR